MGQLETNLQTAVANPKQIASLAGGPESVCVCVYMRLCACVYVFFFVCVCVRVLGPEFSCAVCTTGAHSGFRELIGCDSTGSSSRSNPKSQ